MTGSLARCATAAGRQTFTNKQSSDEFADIAEPRGKPACGHCAPKLLASRSPCHAGTGWSGRQRLSPTGGAAYGIPLKLEISLSVTPRTIPEAIRTVGVDDVVLSLVPFF